MEITLTSDSHWESKTLETVHELTDHQLCEYFEEKSYGSGLDGVSVFFICRYPFNDFKRRIRLSKKEKVLYMDIILDFPTTKGASPEERKRIVTQELYDEVPEVLSRYKIPDFDRDAFVLEFRKWINRLGWR